MALISIGVTRDQATGNALHVTMNLREVKIANSLTVDVPIPEEVANNKPTNGGQQNPSPASPVQETTAAEVPTSLTGFFTGA
jgi:hypothetical protein